MSNQIGIVTLAMSTKMTLPNCLSLTKLVISPWQCQSNWHCHTGDFEPNVIVGGNQFGAGIINQKLCLNFKSKT